MAPDALNRLRNLVDGKNTLIQKALNTDSLAITLTDKLNFPYESAPSHKEVGRTFSYRITYANTNVSMMGESFKMCAPVCGSLGISAEDASVALGLMANAGIKGSQAGSSLRTGLVNLSKPTKQMTE